MNFDYDMTHKQTSTYRIEKCQKWLQTTSIHYTLKIPKKVITQKATATQEKMIDFFYYSAS